VVEKSLKE
jgi:hypothetical protein